MAHTFFNFCDRCRRISDLIYIDEDTGEELCWNCYNEIFDDSDDDFEYDDED